MEPGTERPLTTGMRSEGWQYSELPGVCRRAVEATAGMEIFAGNVIITLFVSHIPMGFMIKHMSVLVVQNRLAPALSETDFYRRRTRTRRTRKKER